MKKRMKLIGLFAAGVMFLSSTTGWASGGGSGLTANEALKNLMDGNKRFVEGRMTATSVSNNTIREKLAAGQAPYAIIVCCSDSRVPPELVFDEGLGRIFVVRVAGNVVDPVVLGSVEYAAEHLGSPLIMVLGHEKCGAVKATVEAKGQADGNIGAIVKAIAPAIGKAKAADPESVADANIALVKSNLTAQSPVLDKLVKAGTLKVVTAKYHIDHGEVQVLEGL